MGGWGASGTASCGGACPRRITAYAASGRLSNCRWGGGRSLKCLLIVLEMLSPGCGTRCCVADYGLGSVNCFCGNESLHELWLHEPFVWAVKDKAAATICVPWQCLEGCPEAPGTGLCQDGLAAPGDFSVTGCAWWCP